MRWGGPRSGIWRIGALRAMARIHLYALRYHRWTAERSKKSSAARLGDPDRHDALSLQAMEVIVPILEAGFQQIFQRALQECMKQHAGEAKNTLTGLVERVTFHNDDNGFCVLRVKARGRRDLITVVGHAAVIATGELSRPPGTGTMTGRTASSSGRNFSRACLPQRSRGSKSISARA
jgi:hypothetical protein